GVQSCVRVPDTDRLLSLGCFVAFAVDLFFFHDPAPTELYTLSLHDALPIWATSESPLCAAPGTRRRWPRCRPQSTMQRCSRDCPDRKSTRLNSSHVSISYAVFCLKKKSNNPFSAVKRLHAPLQSARQSRLTP